LRSKKGFIITAIILAAITAGSFSIWLIPQNTQTRFVVSNPEEDLNAIIEQQRTISDSMTEEFDKMLTGQITPDNYINIAEVSSTQINSFIIKIIESDVPEDWQASYSEYVGFLRAYNSYLRETIVIADKINENPEADISQDMVKVEELLKEADEYLANSDNSRPA
jgi:hypothetical protein